MPADLIEIPAIFGCHPERSEGSQIYLTPQVITDTISKAINSRNPQTRYAAGYLAKTYLFFGKILPDKTFDKLLDSSLK
jgi:hypothetical protein